MIDWKKRISKDDKYIDLRGLPYYKMTFNKPRKVVLYDIECLIPDEPPDEHCVNYGLDEYDQIFRKTFIPEQVLYPEKDFGRLNWTEKEIESFVDAEYNRRKNGIWFWIKGKKYYIPGQLYFKYNYWKSRTGEEFHYRDHEREVFTVLLNLQRDPIDLGAAIFKSRQMGETENVLCIMYERGTRKRGALTVMQSAINEDHIKRTYKRIIHAHKNMIWYMKPMNTGTEASTARLNLDYPSKYITHAETMRQAEKGNMVNRSAAENYAYPPLSSSFEYGPSKVKYFDGATGVLTSYLDEFGKAQEMNPEEWISTMEPIAVNQHTGRKRGFIIMTSTVEDDGDMSLEYSTKIYREANPSKRLSTGRTLNGLVRIFRGVADRGYDQFVADRWGFIDKEAVIQAVTEKYNAFMEAGNIRGAMSFLRKNPRTIDDVFMSARNQSAFNTVGLSQRDHYLNEIAKPKPWVRGNLKWKDGVKDSEVIWEPNENGRWVISKHPKDYGVEANARSRRTISAAPGNSHVFCMGVDPVDQSKTLEDDSKRSRIGIVVMSRLDELIDSDKNLWHQEADDVRGINVGDPVMAGEMHKTNRVVCTYLHRSSDVFDNFEDIILTAVYYGTDFLPENNKAGALKTFLRTRRYDLYLSDKPAISKNYRGQFEKDGITGSEKTFNECFSFIETYTYKWYNAIDHPDLCAQLLTMNWHNRGEKDLGVAFGWCLYHSHQVSRKPVNKEDKREERRHFLYNEV